MPSPPQGGVRQLALEAAYPPAIWIWCFALFGTATRFLSGERRVVRYLADSSYWIYPVHLPLVVAYKNGAPIRLQDIGRVLDILRGHLVFGAVAR